MYRSLYLIFSFCGVLFVLNTFAQAHNETNPLKDGEHTLGTVLEKMRTESGVNFIYASGSVGDIRIDTVIPGNLSIDNLEKLLAHYNLSCRFFGKDNAVIFKNKARREKKEKNIGTVVIKNITDYDTADIIEPKLITETSPVYPRKAVIDNIEGTVKIKLLITQGGNVYKTVIQKSSGSQVLDSATVEYANKLKFIPAQVNGENHIIWLSMVFQYYITNKWIRE